MSEEVQRRTAANRRVIAGLFAELDDDQLSTPSLCAGWTCRGVLGHLTMSSTLGFTRFLLEVARDRGRADVTSNRLARAHSARPAPDLVQSLHDHADAALSPPDVGPLGPFTDSCIHLRDVAIPLGIPTTPPVQDWARALDFFTTPRARAAGFLPRGRLDGSQLRASDQPWSTGTGDVVTGPSEALALSITGRAALLGQLDGAGLTTLRRRVGGPP